MANEIVHVEILAKELGQSSKFYGDLFGWQMTPWGDGYMMFKAGDGIGGALMSTTEEWPPVVIYIQVDDIEAKLKEIEACGGKILVPKTVITEEMGCFGVFADPSGNSVGLYSKS